mmetsp:Transcript_10951/g.23273  ORF Transcript_10951/g.23273 Transcript_10951/m.23273 type:complete len:277 (+) Transcript_10951:120-950(+)
MNGQTMAKGKGKECATSTRSSMIAVDGIVGISKPIKKWYRGLIIRQSCHSHLASYYIKMERYLSTISVALTAVTSSAIFTSLSPTTPTDNLHQFLGVATNETNEGDDDLNKPVDDTMDFHSKLAVTAGLIACFNTVLQGITRTLKYGMRGEQHLRAYRDFSRLRFKLESIVGDKPKYSPHTIDAAKLQKWIEKYEEVLEESPIIPQKVFEEIAKFQDTKGLDHTKEDRKPEVIAAEEKQLAKVRESRMARESRRMGRPDVGRFRQTSSEMNLFSRT